MNVLGIIAVAGRVASEEIVTDADGHVTEPPTMWSEYVDPAFRARAPRPAR